MKNGAIAFLTMLFSTVVAISSAAGQVERGLSKAEAAALDAKVNSVMRESGVLQSASTADLRSPIASAIVFVIEEGTRVQKGDRLVEVDSLAIQDEVAIQRTKLAAMKADLIKASTELQTRKLALQGARKIGEKQVKFAELKLELFRGENGEFETAKQDLAEKLAAVEAKLQAESAILDDAQASLRGAGGSKAAVIKAEAARAATVVELSILKRQQKLHELSKGVRLAELELVLMEHKVELDLKTGALQAEVAQAESQLEAVKLEEDVERSKLDSSIDRLKRCIIHAPQDGIVLYPPRRRSGDKIEPGTSVRENQVILQVADPNKLEVAVTVNETRIARVKRGQRARIQVDAFVGRNFEGTVTSISDTPEPSTFLSDVRQYKVIVSLREPIPQLRVGMTAMVEIRTKE